MSWWSYRKGHSEVILDAFWSPCGRIFWPFWGHVEVKNLLGRSLGALFVLEIVFLAKTPAILVGFGSLLGRFSKTFSYFLQCKICNRFSFAFTMIFHWFSSRLDKQKWANCMGGPAKIKLSCCLLSNVFGNGFWMDFGVWLETIFGPKWPSEATSKASVIKYANGEGSKSIDNPPPPF